MEKDAAAHRRHRPGPGVPASGVAAGHLKAACEMAELQRSRSMGGLHQKGDPPSCVKKLSKGLESEDQGKDPQSDTEEAGWLRGVPEALSLGEGLGMQPSWPTGSPRPRRCHGTVLEERYPVLMPGAEHPGLVLQPRPPSAGQEEGPLHPVPPGSAGGTAQNFANARGEREPESIKVDDPPGKEKPSVFVEIDLGDHAEEVVAGAMREEKRSQMDTGDLSEEETRTSWVCCIPYSARRKAKESV
ncbi:uncharacterized protein C13orf46 homolog [Meles meles]|uniref:uncharacterized protein C13orf46 homolog n=1 Tax=Meles meles TaxID=9662 RepID=UPI001E698E99|nr:uncharacterized protein C13orf46 homolog [Meles meles]